MAGTTNIYKVHYHFEAGGKKTSPEYIDWVSASANDFNSLRTVLSNNSRLLGPGTLVIDACMSAPSGSGVLLS
jgi:hypothetical protein